MFLDPGSPQKGPTFLPLPTQTLEQILTGAGEPGVTTLRINSENQIQLRDQHAREIEIEVCFVCKKCRVAFTTESNLLTHQRQCFGGNLDNRGTYRLVQNGYECKTCPGEQKFRNVIEYKKHTETEGHLIKICGERGQSGNPPPSESPLSHEMEDVVNQITMLAARAAQEATCDTRNQNSIDSNSNSTFCQPEPKRRFLQPTDVAQPLTSTGH